MEDEGDLFGKEVRNLELIIYFFSAEFKHGHMMFPDIHPNPQYQ